MSKCSKCKGTGKIKEKHFIVLNWPVAIIGFFFGPFAESRFITEKKPGWVEEVKVCPDCKGSGQA